MFPTHLTNTVFLDYFKEEDATEFYQLINKNRAYLKQFLPWLNTSNSPKDTLSFIQNATIENKENKALTLCIRDDDKIIGVICFHLFKVGMSAAGIGYWIDKDAQGKGIITAACRHLIQYGFSHLTLLKITISCNINNQKSAAVAERLGFSRKTILPKHEWLYDHYADQVCYEISVEEWDALKKL